MRTYSCQLEGIALQIKYSYKGDVFIELGRQYCIDSRGKIGGYNQNRGNRVEEPTVRFQKYMEIAHNQD